ncbi:MAG: biotin--[acetyl-CoA-carboxylase] ligase [Microbacteriaceae bacterium]
MHLPRSAAATERLVVVPSTGSTNADLVARAGAEPHFSVLVTADQRAGRGRMGRGWIAPPGRALAVSVLLRPDYPLERSGWVPLVAGLAMVRAIAALLPERPVGLKWPNDPQVGGRKVAGVLAELVPGVGVVVGVGVNLALGPEELPTPTATSLAVEGPPVVAGVPLAGDALADAVLLGYLTGLRALDDRLAAAAGDAERSGIRALVAEACTTIGRRVRVELPGGGVRRGRALGLDAAGRLEVATEPDGAPLVVAAGDVTHLRYE